MANGCVAGQDVSAAEVLELQSSKDLTPVGAVEFLGVWLQFGGAANPYFTDGFTQVMDSTTQGSMRDLLLAVPVDQPAYEDGENHRKSLVDGYYYIESASSDEVVVSVFGYVTDENSDPSAQKVIGSGTYVLAPGANGWLIDSATEARSPEDIASIGTAFEGGC